MELLLQAKPEAARLTLCGGETILHLCVKNWQLEALKLLVSSVNDPEFVKCRDGEGNTLLHLAVEYKQVVTIKLLVNNGAADEVDVNAVNHKGLTAMDVLIRSRSDVRDLEIRTSLNRAAAGGAAGASMADRRIHDKHWLVKHIRDFENAIMVMASVIAAMAFQVALYPPGGLWQDDNYLLDKAGKMVDPLGNRISHVDSQNRTVLNPHRAGYSILATNYFVKCKDGEGNTLLHLAVEYKQVETINLLVNNGAADEVDVNAVNHKGLTAMDVLIRSRSDVRDSEIRESLNRAAGGAAGASLADKIFYNDEHPAVKMIRKLENGITIVASVVAAMTLQVAVNPPGGVWQDDNYLFDKDGNTVDPLGNLISYAVDSQNRTVRNPHRAGYSIMGINHPDLVSHLYLFNTMAYYSCMSIILLMLTGLPSRYGFFAFLLMFPAFFAIQAAVGTYKASVRAWMPPKEYREFRMSYKIGTISFLSCIVLSVAYFGVIWAYPTRRFRAARRAKPSNFEV